MGRKKRLIGFVSSKTDSEQEETRGITAEEVKLRM
jgi:hypothetical protein